MSNVLPRRIYVASSWRNPIQPEVVRHLREAGHEVYDFRNPAPGQEGFSWRECGGAAATDGPGAGARTIPAYLEAVRSERAAQGFARTQRPPGTGLRRRPGQGYLRATP